LALGIHRAILEETTAFTLQQRRYGSPLCELPAIQQKLGAMQSQLMTAELALYHAAHLLDQGHPCDADLVNAKLITLVDQVTLFPRRPNWRSWPRGGLAAILRFAANKKNPDVLSEAEVLSALFRKKTWLRGQDLNL
jgi:alkylation response protein AidB-like acyl-CoA dehydrogenase